MFQNFFNVVFFISTLCAALPTYAAIALDRTRAIFPGSEKNITLSISNENKKLPYLAQSWLEDANGNKSGLPFAVVPAIQRVEAGQKSVIRINAVNTASLPQDRESVFWFSVREVPPKSENPNVMQIALQTKIKLFYRPDPIQPEKYSRWDDQLILHRVAEGYKVENPTPYYMNIIAITGTANERVDKKFTPVMIAPKSSSIVKAQKFKTPYVTTINDFGGKPVLSFTCKNDICRADAKSNLS